MLRTRAQRRGAACRFQWLFKAFRLGKLGPQGQFGAGAGKDLADRCIDSVLAFLAHELPMNKSLRESVRERLHARHRDGAPPLDTQALPPTTTPQMRALTEWQAAIFGGGGAYNGGAVPGYTAMRVYSKASQGPGPAPAEVPAASRRG